MAATLLWLPAQIWQSFLKATLLSKTIDKTHANKL
jgi:hypothetical protein